MATFRARARTLDLLGRQQIAGRPTAISELFKNAHDAYAKRAVADFYHSDRLFILRDDGIGMSKEEFVGRWLTLGTESKAHDSIQDSKPKAPEGFDDRPMLGEKGIGRLAIASIGEQVLVLTRARRGKQLSDLVAAFIPWTLFTCPALDLDDIEVPIQVFPGGTLPNKEAIATLVAQSRENVRALQEKIRPERAAHIIKGLKAFDVDPNGLARGLGAPSLLGDGHGTHFYIKPADDTLLADIAGDGKKEGTTPLQKMLIGFTNTMVPIRARTDFLVSFNEHRTDDATEDLLNTGYFLPDDFALADHRLSGRFDPKGTFAGRFRVYERTFPYEVKSPFGGRRTTECGPFSIEFAYVHGDIKDSLLYQRDQEEYYRLTDLLKRFGGLYIYRDGVRILPYGHPEVDFLEIEERRSKGAGYYFFSYRRMFGAIDLSSSDNRALQEKAGREGFIDDLAYQQLKKLLINLLVNVAADYFRTSAEAQQVYEEQRAAINDREDLRRRREAESKVRRATFERLLRGAAQQLEVGEPKKQASAIILEFEKSLESAVKGCLPEIAAQAVADLETNALGRLDDMRSRLSLSQPRGLGLSDRVMREYEDFQERLDVVKRTVLSPARERVEELADGAARELAPALKRRKRAEASLRAAVTGARKAVGAARAQVEAAASALARRVGAMAEGATDLLNAEVTAAEERLSSPESPNQSGPEFLRARRQTSERLRKAADEAVDRLTKARDALAVVNKAIEGGLKDTPDDLAEAMEEELLALRERASTDLELAQLGMAIQVINHEFSASIKAVRGALRRLKGWAEANSALEPVYSELRSTFDHLDGYLTLFTPLQRRLYRTRVTITGANIAKFLEDLFKERMVRHGITLKLAKSFTDHSLSGYPSTFLPVFVNLVDNAIYWLRDRSGERTIRLHASGNRMMVSDTGPGISKRDRVALFRRGFTRKAAGRGLGLYISRAVLARDGFEIQLGSDDGAEGTTWVIKPKRPA